MGLGSSNLKKKHESHDWCWICCWSNSFCRESSWFCCCVAWVILGGTVHERTRSQDLDMHREVGRLWGGEQVQHAPTLTRLETVRQSVTRPKEGAPGEAEGGAAARGHRDLIQ